MSLFGAAQQPQQQTSAFGSPFNKPLFGASTQQTSQPQQNSSPFGGLGLGQNQQQQQPQQTGTSSLFGGANKPTTSLFGQSNAQQNQAQAPSGGLFGGGNSTQQQSQLGSSFANNNVQLTQLMQQSQISARLAETLKPREKSIPEQMELLLQRWSPQSPACLMQSYFYNTVPPGTAPFWSPGPEDDETKWEEALAKKPDENSVPVLARGFQQLAMRLSMQVQAIQSLQQRLHEMNNSLDAMLQNHELQLSVRANEARRKHIGLSQKCLGLAIKVQVLRSRGFVMDAAEEELRRKLESLERSVFDPAFAGREEEIWARMLALRERTAWLSRESEKLGRQVESGEKAGISEDVLAKVKKILSDYDVQITHLKKELDSVLQEYHDWETGKQQA